jgi:peptide/nickel transport system ATP-binding protein
MAKEIIRLNPSPPARTRGQVFFEGADMVALPRNKLRQIRGAKISMIFQEPMTSLNPVFTIGQQMTAGIQTHLKLSMTEATRWAAEMLIRSALLPPGTPQAIPA